MVQDNTHPHYGQSCLVIRKIIQRFGLQEKDFIPVTMCMFAASDSSINILGATILRLSGKSKNGELLKTCQITSYQQLGTDVYKPRDSIALGVISEQFPMICEASPVTSTPTAGTQLSEAMPQSALTASCSCPRRQLPPPHPTQLPFEPGTAKRALIQQWLLDYYTPSTFNTCKHQPLPLTHS